MAKSTYLQLFVTFYLLALPVQITYGEILYDKYGQSKKVDFPEKVKSDDELKSDVDRDKQFYASFTPPSLDKYGGLAGSKEKYGLKSTGFFNVQKIGERFVLVTPEGNMYFAIGVGGLTIYHDRVNIKGKELEFEWLPPKNSAFKKAYLGEDQEWFSFYIANLIKKYGNFNSEWWKKDWVYRLRQLGFNSHNIYGSGVPRVSIDTNFPITIVINEIRSGEKDFIFGFIDPFNEESRNRIDQDMKNLLTPYKDIPEIIGYYVQNEPDFSFIPTSVPKMEGKVPAKQRLVKMLREKYKTTQAFNKAWNLDIKDFNDLLAPICGVTPAAGKDMDEYYEIFLDAYYKCVTDIVRKYDTNHLLLGSRARVRDGRTDMVNRIAGKYMDVLSINYYSFYFDKGSLIRAHQQSGKPYILSEWDYDTRDQGLMRSLRGVENQAQRGKAYRNYVEQAASLPFIVGVQWWCMLDHQDMGVNSGLVNIADRPYINFLNEVVKTNYNIYSVMMGQREPYGFKHPLFTEQKGKTKKVIDIPHALSGMAVDGIQSPWPNRPSDRITSRDIVDGDPCNIDNEADFWLCWDSKMLYLYIDVKDSTPRLNENTGNSVWNGDAIELFLGPLTESSGFVSTDRQLIIAASKQNQPAYYWYRAQKQFKIDVVLQNSSSGKGYVMEAGIPFEALNLEPKPGLEFMFDIAIDDGNGSARIRQFIWNGPDKNDTSHQYWGRARLAE